MLKINNICCLDEKVKTLEFVTWDPTRGSWDVCSELQSSRQVYLSQSQAVSDCGFVQLDDESSHDPTP